MKATITIKTDDDETSETNSLTYYNINSKEVNSLIKVFLEEYYPEVLDYLRRETNSN